STAGGVVTVNQWNLIAVRFPASTTGFPTFRVNGAAPASGTVGASTATGNLSGGLQFMRNYSTGGGGQPGFIAHVAIFAGELSDSDIGTTEAAAATEGWI